MYNYIYIIESNEKKIIIIYLELMKEFFVYLIFLEVDMGRIYLYCIVYSYIVNYLDHGML